MPIKNFHIYQSSAGSGKTYTLTREYLKLALKRPDYYRSILAVTFTNKATEEMKTRIVDTLAALAKGRHPIAGELEQQLNFSADQLQQRAAQVLKTILHNYSSFAVITIDAFFQQVVRSFAREIGVQGSFEVELDQKKVLGEVVDKLVAEIGTNQALTNWLTSFALYKINEGQSWDTRKDILNLSEELFRELFIEEKDRIFACMQEEDFMPSFMQSLHDVVADFEKKQQQFGLQAVQIMEQHGLTQADFTYGASGVGGYLTRLAQGAIAAPGARAYQALNEDKWYKKTAKNIAALDSAISGGIHAALGDAIDHWEDAYARYHTARQITKNMYTFGLLAEVSEQLNEYREENDLLLIADFPVFLHHIIRDSDTPYIYEKIGSRYHHYLIDEFQDTSGLQWQNFKPLVKDVVDAGKFSMVVGDIKQSIYRWRGGNWKLLLEKIAEDVGENFTRNIPLATNWRSKKKIVEFNNDLFTQAPLLLHSYFVQEAGEQVEEIHNIKKAYAEVRQEYVDSEKAAGGLIEVQFVEKQEYDDPKEEAAERLVQMVEKLQDANYLLRDIAILVRNKNEGKRVTDALMQREEARGAGSAYRYDIISNESLFLKNAPAVHLLVCALKVLVYPAESLFRSELAYAWQVYWHDSPPAALAEWISDPKGAVALLADNRDRLLALNLIDQVEALIRLFGLQQKNEQLAYLLAFQDAVLDFYEKENGGSERFLNWWEDNSTRAIQVSDELEAMRLMTIHKSKGLQFKVVILPFCNWRMDHNPTHDNIVWCNTGEEQPFARLPYVPLKYKKDMAETVYGADYWDEKVKAYVDNLNLLYVACTRAEEALYIVAEKDERKNYAGVNDLLYSYFTQGAEPEGWQQEDGTYRYGELSGYSVYERSGGAQEVMLQRYLSNPWQERTDLVVKSGRMITDDDVLQRINEGVVVHDILSKVNRRKDFEKAMKSAVSAFGLGQEELEGIKATLRKIFTLPAVNDWYTDQWQVKNETSIICSTGEVKRPDRVMINGSSAVVVDFKTGEPAKAHHSQVKQYIAVLKEMGYTQVEGRLLYINRCEIHQVAT